MDLNSKLERLHIPYDLLLERIDEGAVLLENREIQYINAKGANILGAEYPQELIGMDVIYFLNPEEYSFDGNMVRVKHAIDIDEKYKYANIKDMMGNKKTLKYYKEKIHIGEYKLTFVVFRNETPYLKKDMEAHLFRQTVEYSPIQIVMTDVHGNIEYANHAFLHALGYSMEEVIGKKPRLFKSEEHDEAFYRKLWETISKGDIWRGYFKNQKKDKTTFWASATIACIRNKNKEIIKYIAMEEDISDKMDMAESLEKRNSELNKLVEELGEAQNQLIQKEKLAGIGELAAGVAHEINNPLGFIISNTSTLKSYVNKLMNFVDLAQQLIQYIESGDTFETDATLDALKGMSQISDLDFIKEDLNDLFGDMDEGLERVKKIVHGLRMFSRVDQNEEMTDYNINEGIQDTLVVANNEIKYDARVELDLDESIPIVQANGGQLNQVLLNLIINAVHAIREKSNDMGTINIQTRYINGYVECKISDTGIGINDDTMKKIFDPFFTTKPMGVGTGLGLSISYDIVTNKHDGYLRVQSQKGVGTDFVIGLPRKAS